jgi:hypothetical protein
MKLYFFGKEYGRVESSIVEGTNDLSIINQVRDLNATGEKHAAYELIEDQETDCAWELLCAVIEEGSEFNIDDLENNGHSYVVVEEFQAGIGKTPELAKVAFANSMVAY